MSKIIVIRVLSVLWSAPLPCCVLDYRFNYTLYSIAAPEPLSSTLRAICTKNYFWHKPLQLGRREMCSHKTRHGYFMFAAATAQ